MKKYACPCCGNYTLPEFRIYDICPVCNWEDDIVQFQDSNFEGGANEESLNQARINYRKYGAINKKYVKEVRKPLDIELPENND